MKLGNLINRIVSTSEFWKINYYMRSMKKAPHGGVFCIKCPNMFLKHYSVHAYSFFISDEIVPMPVRDALGKFRTMIDTEKIEVKELLQYCFSTEMGNSVELRYIATSGNVITPIAGDTNNINVNEERLILLFVFTLIERLAYKIDDVNEIVRHERMVLPIDKYGLCDVTNAKFERQGFRMNDEYYLYNIFLNTSIGSLDAIVPKTIEIMQHIRPSVKILMRCDENLAVPYSQMVCTSTVDFQKWRGVTLSFDKITEIMKNEKETIVHYDPQTFHKILVYLKKGTDANGYEFYHINVEQLWNPEILGDDEDMVITNYIHGTYYPICETFEHIDFSVNQYRRDTFELKYQDAEKLTGVSINEYADIHYKVWCIRGRNLTTSVWVDLVCATLDDPFRKIFMETIGGTYIEE